MVRFGSGFVAPRPFGFLRLGFRHRLSDGGGGGGGGVGHWERSGRGGDVTVIDEGSSGGAVVGTIVGSGSIEEFLAVYIGSLCNRRVVRLEITRAFFLFFGNQCLSLKMKLKGPIRPVQAQLVWAGLRFAALLVLRLMSRERYMHIENLLETVSRDFEAPQRTRLFTKRNIHHSSREECLFLLFIPFIK